MYISHTNLGKIIAESIAHNAREEKYIQLTKHITACVFRSGADKFNLDIIKDGNTIDCNDDMRVYDMASHLMCFEF